MGTAVAMHLARNRNDTTLWASPYDESVFSALTGRPGASAYKELTDLLQAHVPMGKPFIPVSDNLFPLQEARQRAVSRGAEVSA